MGVIGGCQKVDTGVGCSIISLCNYRSGDGGFNPQPKAESCRSHTLVGLLSQVFIPR